MAAAKEERDWKDAEDSIRKAREAAGTTLFRWTPEWEKAASEFEAAARKFTKLGVMGLTEAAEAYKGASEAHKELKSLNAAARCMELAAMTEAKLPNSSSQAAKTYKAAAELFRDNDQTGKAAQTLLVGAALVKNDDTELALALMMQACGLWEADEERAIQGQDTFKTCIAYLIELEQYADAMMQIDNLNKILMKSFDSKQPFIYRNHLACIILALGLQDIEMAFNNYERFAQTDGFMESEQSTLANELLIAFDEADDERLKQTLKATAFNLLDAPIARIAKRLTISDAVRASAGERQAKKDAEELDLT